MNTAEAVCTATQCAKPERKKLGIADNTEAYSSCEYDCVHLNFSFMDFTTKAISLHKERPDEQSLHYVGLAYQCVEYARRWWMINLGIKFDEVDSAYEITHLAEGRSILNNETFPLGHSMNGSATHPPQKGDLLIYRPSVDDPRWQHGHVAVIVDVDTANGYVSLAEQNHYNLPWQNPDRYARRVGLFQTDGLYRLMETNTAHQHINGDLIVGWVYRLPR